jgi:hypothetical protein
MHVFTTDLKPSSTLPLHGSARPGEPLGQERPGEPPSASASQESQSPGDVARKFSLGAKAGPKSADNAAFNAPVRRFGGGPKKGQVGAVGVAPISESERQAKIAAEIAALRTANSHKSESARSWSYLAMEGGKGKNANRKQP